MFDIDILHFNNWQKLNTKTTDQKAGLGCNEVLLLRYFSEYFLLATSYNFML